MFPVVVFIVSVVVWFVVDVVFDVVHELKIGNTEYKSTVPLTRLVNEVMNYTGEIFNENGIKHYPVLELRYYKHKKWLGLHRGDGTIIIYTKSNTTVQILIDTTLHEISHHISMKTKCDSWVRYDQILKEIGYQKHPEEIKARNFASQNLEPCLKYLLEKNVIIKG